MAPFPDLPPADVKENRDGKQNGRETAQHRHGPVNSKVMKLPPLAQSKQLSDVTYHRQSKQRKSCSQIGPKEAVGRDGRVGIDGIAVDNIIDTLFQH